MESESEKAKDIFGAEEKKEKPQAPKEDKNSGLIQTIIALVILIVVIIAIIFIATQVLDWESMGITLPALE